MRVKSVMMMTIALAAPVGVSALSVSMSEWSVSKAPAPAVAAPLAGKLLADSELDNLRGGFEAQSGLQVSFGIERVVVVNGQLLATTTLNLVGGEQGLRLDSNTLGQGGLRVFSGGGQGGAAALSLGVIQVGPNNLAQIDPATVAGTLIQNSLSDQRIQNITTITAQVNTASLMKSRMLQENLRAASVSALRQ